MKRIVCILISTMICYITSRGHVCSESELIKELKEDFADNGKLDCLRESLPLPGESPEDKIARISANWDGDCSFEASGWETNLKKNFPQVKSLVDVDGKKYDQNKPTQADMCEIIRSFIGNNMIPGASINGSSIAGLSDEITKYLNCPGSGANLICAATGGNFSEKGKWNILIEGEAVSFNGNPKYSLS